MKPRGRLSSKILPALLAILAFLPIDQAKVGEFSGFNESEFAAGECVHVLRFISAHPVWEPGHGRKNAPYPEDQAGSLIVSMGLGAEIFRSFVRYRDFTSGLILFEASPFRSRAPPS